MPTSTLDPRPQTLDPASFVVNVLLLQDDISQAGQGTPQPSPGLISPRPSPWLALQLALSRALYYLGFLALPAILFWVGLSSRNLLHAAYLALLVVWFLAHSLSLEPHVRAGALGRDQASGWAVLCCAVLCCAVLCCAVLCCAVLCCNICCAIFDLRLCVYLFCGG